MAMLTSMQLLAQREAWENLGNRFTGNHLRFHWGDLGAMFGILTGAVLFVLLLRWLYRVQQARIYSNEPRHLFIDLCRAHRLRRRERRLLRELATASHLEQPALVFVRPDLFEPETMLDEKPKKVQAYERLAVKLFAGLEKLAPATNLGGSRANVVIPSLAAKQVAIAPRLDGANEVGTSVVQTTH